MNVPDFSSLASSNSLFWMGVGAVAMRLYLYAQDKYNDWKHPENAPHTRQWKTLVCMWLLVGIAFSYMFVQTNEAYELTKANGERVQELAIDTQKCQNTILESVTALMRISA